MKTTTKITAGLSQLLANTYVLYVKTQNFHWNVTGPHFYTYHELFEAQYKQLGEAIDIIAERIRSLHDVAPGSMAELLKSAALQESTGHKNAKSMLQELLANHELIGNEIVSLFEIAKAGDDEVTLDLLIERKAEHDKMAWMLHSSLE
jgi:starvation-inducible DNA-binding protein